MSQIWATRRWSPSTSNGPSPRLKSPPYLPHISLHISQVTYLWTHGANLGRPNGDAKPKSLELIAGAMVLLISPLDLPDISLISPLELIAGVMVRIRALTLTPALEP